MSTRVGSSPPKPAAVTPTIDNASVNRECLAEDLRVAAELPGPVAVADHRDERAGAVTVVLGGEPAPDRHRHTENRVIVAADELSARHFDAIARGHSERGLE